MEICTVGAGLSTQIEHWPKMFYLTRVCTFIVFIVMKTLSVIFIETSSTSKPIHLAIYSLMVYSLRPKRKEGQEKIKAKEDTLKEIIWWKIFNQSEARKSFCPLNEVNYKRIWSWWKVNLRQKQQGIRQFFWKSTWTRVFAST